MSGFSASWLDLREAADLRSREPRLLIAAAQFVKRAPQPRVVDLGTGTGAMARAFAPYLGKPVEWLLVDADPALLVEADARAGDLPGMASVLKHDLASDAPLPLERATIATASALFDLVSETFADRLIAALATRKVGLHANLIYDGKTEWRPPHRLDGTVVAAFNRHQRRDKGFGPALGPTAPTVVAQKLTKAGFHVSRAPSPWRLEPTDADLQRALVTGIAEAAREDGQIPARDLDAWLDFRLRNAPVGRCDVGHVDLFALL